MMSGLDGNEVSHLDPQLWKELPPELLETVISKLPFPKIADFRRVCKFWYSEVIPHAAALVGASTSRSTLLYFDYFRNEMGSKGYPWWMPIDKANGLLQTFHQKSFPSPRSGEIVELLDSQNGLLFFGFKERKSGMVRDIVVCNPLTAKSKSLGLPKPTSYRRDSMGNPLFFVGVVFEGRRNFNFVTVGIDGTGQYISLLYNSTSCTWKNSTCRLPAELRAGGNLRGAVFSSGRSAFCNGKLCWLLRRYSADDFCPLLHVLEFNSAKDQWRLVPVNIDPRCPLYRALHTQNQMAAYYGVIVLWHLAPVTSPKFNLLVESATPENVDFVKSELFDQDYFTRYQESSGTCLCDFGTTADPEINPIQHLMPEYIERINMLLSIYEQLGDKCLNYLAFSEGNFVYHLLHLSSSFIIVTHNTEDNSFEELPAVPQDRFPKELLSPSDHYCFSISNVWSFSPSLTSSP